MRLSLNNSIVRLRQDVTRLSEVVGIKHRPSFTSICPVVGRIHLVVAGGALALLLIVGAAAQGEVGTGIALVGNYPATGQVAQDTLASTMVLEADAPGPIAQDKPLPETRFEPRATAGLAAGEGTEAVAPAGDPELPAIGLKSYRVQPGDTVKGIAKKNGIDWQELVAINNLARPEKILPGQMLAVPQVAVLGTLLNPPAGTTTAPSADVKDKRDQAAPAGAITGKREEAVPSAAVTGKREQELPAPATAGNPEAAAETATTGKPEEAGREAAAESKREGAAPSARGAKLASWQEDFLAIAADAARVTQQATGVPASVTVAQAILESDWGRATAGGNNYFGIKATTKPGPAGVVWVNTKEFTGKGWITIQAPFRAYENMAQSFTDHGMFFVENSRYAEAMRNAADPKRFAELIQKAGYATDPNYAKSLIRLMDQFDLYRHDLPH